MVGAVALTLGAFCHGASPSGHAYASDQTIVQKFAENLCETLPPKFANKISPHPLLVQPQQDTPVIAPVLLTDESKSSAEICVSAGFIDLMNRLAHAKAIDRIQPGFFAAYVQNLSHPGPLVLPDIVDAKYWTDDVMDEQAGYFNQMVSILMAINLSHHYLGHYAKYAGQLANPENRAVPINQVLNADEWSVSVKCGVKNSLDCGLATEGVRALFEALDRMPQRPPWTLYLVPQFADLKKLNKQLAAWEDDYFHGKFKDL